MGTGFVFYEPTAAAFRDALRQARVAYEDPAAWDALQSRAMQASFSWDVSAQHYVNVYNRALGRSIRSLRTGSATRRDG